MIAYLSITPLVSIILLHGSLSSACGKPIDGDEEGQGYIAGSG
jgi:hypothetical protein